MQISVVRLVRRRGLEIALAVSLLSLGLQLSWPAACRAWRAPRPGSMGIAYLQGAPLAGLGPPYHARLPTGYTNARRWPLVVYLHGSGDTNKGEFQRGDVGPVRSRHAEEAAAVMVSPVCTGRGGWEPAAVDAFVSRMLQVYSIDESRVYLIGYSMGGYGTWRTAAAYPERFAAVVPIAGGGDPGEAGRLTTLPIWAFHGEQDHVVKVSGTRDMVSAIRAAGGSPRVTYYPRAGHGVSQLPYADPEFWQWLLGQSSGRQSGAHAVAQGDALGP